MDGVPLARRSNSWVQKYDSEDLLFLFLQKQFSNPEEGTNQTNRSKRTTNPQYRTNEWATNAKRIKQEFND